MVNNKKLEKRALKILQQEGFEIVRAEENPEYKKKLTNYTKTPDFIQYPASNHLKSD